MGGIPTGKFQTFCNFRLKSLASVGLKRKQEGQHNWERDMEPSLAIDFTIKDILKCLRCIRVLCLFLDSGNFF